MIGIDSNVLIRYIVQDDPRQARAATRLIEGQCTADDPGFVSHIVVCELVWVLTSGYRYAKSEVVGVLEQLLRVAQLRVEDPQILWRTLEDFRGHRADFSDHLIGRLHAAQGCDRTVTFDRLAAGGAVGFELVR